MLLLENITYAHIFRKIESISINYSKLKNNKYS